MATEAPTMILARRTATDVLLADGAAAMRCAWRGLASSDGAEVSVEWSARVSPVDSPADRELLAEQFLGAGVGATLDAAAGTAFFERSCAATIRRAVATHAVDTLLRGDADPSLTEALATEAKRVGFAVGLAVLGPFTVRIESPSVQRERQLAQTRARLAALAELDGARARSIASLAQTLAELPEPTRAARVLADLRLGDPLDLLRATAIADASWSAATPRLWVAAGDRVGSVNPTAPTLDAATSIRVGGIGPLRSIRSDTIGGQPVLLIGGRGGVAIVDPGGRSVRATFTCNTTSDFGFNGACAVDGLLVATHSALGLVTWPLDQPSAGATIVGGGAARSPLRCGERSVALIVDGRAALFTPDDGFVVLAASPADLAELERVDDHTVVGLSSTGACHRADCGSMHEAWTPLSVATRGGNSIASLDLCGTPRVVALTADGAVRILDPHGGEALSVGASRNGGARLVRARPGFIATVSADRTRVGLIELAKPDAVAAELHVAVALGHRVADCWFA